MSGRDIILLVIAIFALYYLINSTLETQSVSNLDGKSSALPRTSCNKTNEGFETGCSFLESLACVSCSSPYSSTYGACPSCCNN